MNTEIPTGKEKPGAPVMGSATPAKGQGREPVSENRADAAIAALERPLNVIPLPGHAGFTAYARTWPPMLGGAVFLACVFIIAGIWMLAVHLDRVEARWK